MSQWIKQAQAASHIRELLARRKLDVPSRSISLEDNQRLILFEYQGRQLRIDTGSGLWVRESELDDWRCVAKPCTVSGTIQAVEFLIKD